MAPHSLLSPLPSPLSLLTWPSSIWSCPRWTLPAVPASTYTLSFIYNKPSIISFYLISGLWAQAPCWTLVKVRLHRSLFINGWNGNNIITNTEWGTVISSSTREGWGKLLTRSPSQGLREPFIYKRACAALLLLSSYPVTYQEQTMPIRLVTPTPLVKWTESPQEWLVSAVGNIDKKVEERLQRA